VRRSPGQGGFCFLLSLATATSTSRRTAARRTCSRPHPCGAHQELSTNHIAALHGGQCGGLDANTSRLATTPRGLACEVGHAGQPAPLRRMKACLLASSTSRSGVRTTALAREMRHGRRGLRFRQRATGARDGYHKRPAQLRRLFFFFFYARLLPGEAPSGCSARSAPSPWQTGTAIATSVAGDGARPTSRNSFATAAHARTTGLSRTRPRVTAPAPAGSDRVSAARGTETAKLATGCEINMATTATTAATVVSSAASPAPDQRLREQRLAPSLLQLGHATATPPCTGRDDTDLGPPPRPSTAAPAATLRALYTYPGWPAIVSCAFQRLPANHLRPRRRSENGCESCTFLSSVDLPTSLSTPTARHRRRSEPRGLRLGDHRQQTQTRARWACDALHQRRPRHRANTGKPQVYGGRRPLHRSGRPSRRI